MAVKLLLAPEVEQDIADAYAWYEQRQPGLGEEFLGSVETALDVIRRDPKSYSEIHQSYRRALVRRFPYCVFYEFVNETITVYCITHAARDPVKWRLRMP
jgi:plasmid stabilization system protein ParE